MRVLIPSVRPTQPWLLGDYIAEGKWELSLSERRETNAPETEVYFKVLKWQKQNYGLTIVTNFSPLFSQLFTSGKIFADSATWNG